MNPNRYRLASDQADRIRFDEAVSRFARECVAADVGCVGPTLASVAARCDEFITGLDLDDQEEAVRRFYAGFIPAYERESANREVQG